MVAADGPGEVGVERSQEEIGRLFRHESGRAVASLIRRLGNFDLAEEAVQEAFIVALERWPREGLPDNPGAWITTVAANRALDRLRRESTLREKKALLEIEAVRAEDEPGPGERLGEFPDDRLRLIFTCCHPALAPEARVALTLRTLGGLTTPQIARAFLVTEVAMAQRLARAKRKIRDAGIAYEVPDADRMPERLPSVLATLYLVFNEGYLASETESDALVRSELSGEAIRLARVVLGLMPHEREVQGLLALMLLQDSRREARTEGGELALLEDQDRSRWDRDEIAEGLELAGSATAARVPGPYALQAAIAAEHAKAASAKDTDWERIAHIYSWLAAVQPSPVVELNRAVAVAMAEGPERGLELIGRIDGLEGYLHLHTARGDLLRRLGRAAEARAAYERARELVANPVERRFLERRIAELR